MWTEKDSRYWMQKEEEIARHLVDMEGYGFIIDSIAYKKGQTDDPKLFGRPAAVEALVRARDALPDGMNIIICAAWRPWEIQEKTAAEAWEKIAAAHPDWSEGQVTEHQWKMAPPARVVPRFGSHRYGGAFDITLADAADKEMNLGVPVGYNTGPEARLLYYQSLPDPDTHEKEARDNRRIMIDVMVNAEFMPYPEEFWHWNYLRDIEDLAKV